LKRATGKPLSVFAAENIFQPLGMTHTMFYDDRTVVLPGRVAAYAPGKNGSFTVDWSTNNESVGAGGLMSSVDDLLLWDRNFYANRLGKGTLLKELQTRGVLNNGKAIDYALGLEMVAYRSLPVVEHGGSLFGYRSEILRFPEQHFTVLCLCNLSTSNPASLARKVADIYLEKSLGPAAAPGPPAESTAAKHLDFSVSPTALAEYAGTYKSIELDAIYKLSIEDGSLMLHVGWRPPVKLELSAKDEFEAGSFVFHRNTAGRISGMTVSDGRMRNVTFEKIP
jgi:CubicO group peptidase (beta-lactamase class C family)